MRDPMQTGSGGGDGESSGRIPFSQQAWTLLKPRPNLSAADGSDNPWAYAEAFGESTSAFASGADSPNIILGELCHAVAFPAPTSAVRVFVGIVLAPCRPTKIGKHIVARVAVIMGYLIGRVRRLSEKRQGHNPVDAGPYAPTILSDCRVGISALPAASSEMEDVPSLGSASASAS